VYRIIYSRAYRVGIDYARGTKKYEAYFNSSLGAAMVVQLSTHTYYYRYQHGRFLQTRRSLFRTIE
jgi:hypothetical protein